MQTAVSETTDFPPSAANWLSYIAGMLGAEAGGMLVVRPDGSHSVLAIGHDDNAISQYQDHFSHLDPLPRLLAERPHGRALVIDTTRHPAYLERPELSNDYLRPYGIDHVIATQWRHPDGTLHMVGVQRFRGSDPFSVAQGAELDRYVHHWRVEGAIPSPEGLDVRGADARRSCDIAAQITVPLAVVDSRLGVAWANAAARRSQGAPWVALLEKRSGGVTQSGMMRHLRELVGTCLRKHTSAEALISASDDTWFACAAPVAGKPELALLRLTGMHHLAPGVRNRLEHLYGLTRAEAEITLQLARGDSLDTIAASRAVRLETVRTQLRTVYRKTGTHRQGELVFLVGVLGNG